MPPPFQHKAFHLTLLPNIYFVKQLPASTELSASVLSLLNGPTFFSITRAAEDITIVGELTDNPEIQSLSGGTGDWRCIKIAGPMEFEMTGVVSGLLAPLKVATVPIYVISTWDRDFILVPKEKAEQAIQVLEADGWKLAAVS